MKTLNNTRTKVEKILEEHPECRDSDNRLWLTYLTLHHSLRKNMIDKPELAFETLVLTLMDKETASFETISRVRRKIQGDGKFLAKEGVRKGRSKNQENVSNWSLG